MGVEFRPEIEATALAPSHGSPLRDFIWMVSNDHRLQEFHGRVLVGDARKRTIHLPGTLFCGRAAAARSGPIWCIVEFVPGELRWYCTTSVPPFDT